ncbi:hypothetical protein KCTC32516_00437 [Polaribacter huanghezhanensis]|uniref:gliding motility protein GldL n=1 Tax=Polaribacter huanghezhanensis TaxID=1354726 RepID=UPI0026479071|nr:gliding motility protein GldL [Polaribacter huanghezhanensis]WKD85098.1 hypothetical protein KCTC32516_00437 [Polaribacter huanghezhanensis]
MKLKYIIFIFITGVILICAGALFKILHWMLGPELLISGIMLQIIAFLLFIIKLFTNKKFKAILNQ